MVIILDIFNDLYRIYLMEILIVKAIQVLFEYVL